MITAEQRRLRARMAAHARHNPDTPELAAARQNYRAAQAEHHACEIVAQASELSAIQRDRIAALLRPVLGDELAATA